MHLASVRAMLVLASCFGATHVLSFGGVEVCYTLTGDEEKDEITQILGGSVLAPATCEEVEEWRPVCGGNQAPAARTHCPQPPSPYGLTRCYRMAQATAALGLTCGDINESSKWTREHCNELALEVLQVAEPERAGFCNGPSVFDPHTSGYYDHLADVCTAAGPFTLVGDVVGDPAGFCDSCCCVAATHDGGRRLLEAVSCNSPGSDYDYDYGYGYGYDYGYYYDDWCSWTFQDISSSQRSDGECVYDGEVDTSKVKEVNIGTSDDSSKRVKVKGIANYACPKDVDKNNWIGDKYDDTFTITQGREHVTATRSDETQEKWYNKGWGLNLGISCVFKEFKGHEEVTVIVGDLIIENVMTETLSFPSLKEIKGKISIKNNPGLKTVDLPKLQAIYSFEIEENPELMTMGLPNLQTINGSFDIQKNVMTETLSFPSLKEIKGHFSIKNNPGLMTMGLRNLQTIKGSVDIQNNDKLTVVKLYNVKELEGFVRIENNDKLTVVNLHNGGELEGLAQIHIKDNPELTAVVLPYGYSYGKDFQVKDNLKLKTMDLSNLKKTGSYFLLEGNPSLEKVDLSNVHTVKGHFLIQNNPGLKGLRFSTLRAVGNRSEIDTDTYDYEADISLEIKDNAGLKALYIPKLRTVAGFFGLQDNPELTTVFLPELEIVGRYLDIKNNNELKTVRLPKLKSVGRRSDEASKVKADYDWNDSFDWYESRDSFYYDSFKAKTGFTIENNLKLTTVALPSMSTVGGKFLIENNGDLMGRDGALVCPICTIEVSSTSN